MILRRISPASSLRWAALSGLRSAGLLMLSRMGMRCSEGLVGVKGVGHTDADYEAAEHFRQRVAQRLFDLGRLQKAVLVEVRHDLIEQLGLQAGRAPQASGIHARQD